jgi:hypothetical protein
LLIAKHIVKSRGSIIGATLTIIVAKIYSRMPLALRDYPFNPLYDRLLPISSIRRIALPTFSDAVILSSSKQARDYSDENSNVSELI